MGSCLVATSCQLVSRAPAARGHGPGPWGGERNHKLAACGYGRLRRPDPLDCAARRGLRTATRAAAGRVRPTLNFPPPPHPPEIFAPALTPAVNSTPFARPPVPAGPENQPP